MLKATGCATAVGVGLLVTLARIAEAQEEAQQIERSQVRVERDDEPGVNASAPLASPWMPTFQAALRAGAGAMNGAITSPGRGALTVLDGNVMGSIDRGRLTLELPIAGGLRQTIGTSLSESHLDGSVRASFKAHARVRLAAQLGVRFVSRPGWPDPFQPVEGRMAGTDRYGHWDRASLAEVLVRPARRHRLRLRYDYNLAVYRHDPAFDALYDPTHLAPWDQDTHRLDLVWRRRGRGWNLGLGAELARRRYFFAFAGDAVTGATHAGPGGEPPNPLLRLRWINPRAEFDVDLAGGVVVLAGRYEVELVEDVHQGYLSYVGQHPQLSVTWSLPRAARLSARTELFLRRSGKNSYTRAAGFEVDLDHPPLTWGERRADRLASLELGFRLPLLPHWSAIANSSLAVRRTNYAAYMVRWNYTNWDAWAGAEYFY
jgi:hypothetical protein